MLIITKSTSHEVLFILLLHQFAKSFKVDINVVDDTGDGSLGSTNPLSRRITLSIKSANELSTLLHESGHLMKAWDSDTFYAIQDAVCDWFAKYNNTTLEHLIEMRQAEYTEKEGKTCSYQEAKDEVTCNAIEAIQTADNFAEEFTQTMADLQYPKAEAEGKLTALQKFFRKIKLALNNILERIRNKRSGDLMITAEGKAISKDVAMVNDLLKKVRQGLANVRTNYDAYVAGAEVKSAGDGAIRHMYVDKTGDNPSVEEIEEGKSLKEFVDSVAQMKKRDIVSKRKHKIGDISKEHGRLIESIIKVEYPDFSIDGYELWIDGTGTTHMDKRHGEKGKADHTMALEEDWVIIPWVVNTADGGDFIRYSNGELELSTRFFNDDNTKAPQIRLYKVVNGKTIYVSECVPDSNKKRVYITSSYKTKSSTNQLLNIDPNGSPQPTSVTSFGDHATNNSITETESIVNTNSPTDSDSELKQHISSEAEEQAKADELEALREENKAFKAKGTGDGKVKKMHGETTDFGTTSEDEEKSIKKQIRKNSEALNSMGVLVELNETETFANKTKQESKEWILSELEKRGIEKIIHREGFGNVIFDEKRIKKGYRYFKKIMKS